MELHEMSRAEARVAIAGDVIMQVRLGNYEGGRNYLETNRDTLQELKRKLFDYDTVCRVCVIGGLFVSYARLSENVVVNYQPITNFCKVGMVRNLERYFTHGELNHIEFIFEGWSHDFFPYIRDRSERLIAVMELIIISNGGLPERVKGPIDNLLFPETVEELVKELKEEIEEEVFV